MPYILQTQLGPLLNLDDTIRSWYALATTRWSQEFYETLSRIANIGMVCDLCGSRVSRSRHQEIYITDIKDAVDHPLNTITAPFIEITTEYDYDGAGKSIYNGYNYTSDDPIFSKKSSADPHANKRPSRKLINQLVCIGCRGGWGKYGRRGGMLAIDAGIANPAIAFEFDIPKSVRPNFIESGYYIVPLVRSSVRAI